MKFRNKHNQVSSDRIPSGFSLEQTVNEYESCIIQQALQQCDQNKSRAANLLGLSRSTFRYKLSRLKEFMSHN
jgi:DNA-binding NtrC family response regulator